MLSSSSVDDHAKTCSTLYPASLVENARRNIGRYEWARKIRDEAVEKAGACADQADDFFWEWVTPQSIPREIWVAQGVGCPKCGEAIEKFGDYPWRADAIEMPWKLICPSCGESFPKNDFAKYYESGKDNRGIFDSIHADRSLLFNSDHPNPEDLLHNFGVDDGMGWTDEKGNVFHFVGGYAQFGVWRPIRWGLEYLCDAYIYTGDAKYARKAGILLYRIAEFYPEMDSAYWSARGFHASDGGDKCGKVFGRIEEAGFAHSILSCYDAVYPGLDDPQLLNYLSQKSGLRVEAVDLRGLVEKNIVHEIHDGIIDRIIMGNEGAHQNAMAMAAVLLDKPGITDEWLSWVFADGDVVDGKLTGGNLLRLFDTRIDEDGMGDEASPGYNSIWRHMFRSISDVVSKYPRYKGPKLTDIPKFRKMFETPMRLVCLGKFDPNIGDNGKTGNASVDITVEELIYAYDTFKYPKFAQMAWFLNGGKVDGIRGDIFDPDPERLVKEIEEIVCEQGTYLPRTECMPSYGLAVLRSGAGDASRALALYFGRNTGHGHADTLNIELFAHGVDLMPDLGYPEYTGAWPSRWQWSSHTVSHNTVLVDKRGQRPNVRGTARFVLEGKGVSAAEVYSETPYPQTSLYQRTVAMVDVNEEEFYVVDIFRVHGGNEHHYSLHGPEGEVETEYLNLVSQANGTLAGEDVPFAADFGGREDYWKDSSGFQYLYDVRRDAHPSAISSVTWKVVDTWNLLKEPKDLRLRVNIVSPPGEVVLADGDPPQNKAGNPRRLTYLILSNESDKSTFVSVIEPYSGTRCIESIERIDDGETVILKIILVSGRIDWVISGMQSKQITISEAYEFTGRFGVVSEENGKFSDGVSDSNY